QHPQRAAARAARLRARGRGAEVSADRRGVARSRAHGPRQRRLGPAGHAGPPRRARQPGGAAGALSAAAWAHSAPSLVACLVARRAARGVVLVPVVTAPQAPPARPRRTLLWTSTSYFGEGLPWSFLHQMATEYLTAIGASKTLIGSPSLFHLAVTLKFVWSPLVDLFGRQRQWLVATQAVLGLGMLVTAATVQAGDMTWFWIVLGVLSV